MAVKTEMRRKIAIGLGATVLTFAVGGAGALWSMQPGTVPPAKPVQWATTPSAIERLLESGPITGESDGDIMVFKGIPYAAPPVGALRWRPPQPVNKWENMRVATSFSDDCIQNKASWDPARSNQPMSEDCLGINLWAPAKSLPEGAPVLLWIHGGGFVQGSSSQPALNGEKFAREGVILVSFNYRLGRFGFFAHPALTAESGNEATGNWGLMDQVAALKWVHANIEKFGGDPKRVTLFGQSAGGASVAQLMLDPQVRGMFSGAVIQSSGGRNRWAPLDKNGDGKLSGIEAGVAFAAEQGLTGASEAQLRAIPAMKVLGDVSMTKLQSDSFAGPMIDGKLVLSNFVDGFIAGKEAPVPLIVGSTDAELSHLPILARYGLRQWAKKELGGSLDTIRSSYSSNDEFDDHIVNDWGFAEPARIMALNHAAHGAASWLYSFGYVSTAKRADYTGAPHSSDVTFIFSTLGREGIDPSAEDWEASKLVSAYWLAFAKGGKPAPLGLTSWQPYGQMQDITMSFTPAGATLKKTKRRTQLDAIGRAMSDRKSAASN